MQPPQVLMIPVGEILPDPAQPRQHFDKEAIDRMAASIAARGMLQPIRVRRDAARGCWLIVCGEGRWRGAKQAGQATIPALPVDGELSETDILSDQIIENVVRNSLRPMELARSLAKLKKLTAFNSKQLATELGISGGSITRSEALLTLPIDIQSLIDNCSVSANAGYEISRLPDEASQREMAQEIVASRISRDGTADAVRKALGGKKKAKRKLARLPLRLPGGVGVTLSAASPLTWENLLIAIEQIRERAVALQESGKSITELAKSLAS